LNGIICEDPVVPVQMMVNLKLGFILTRIL